MRGTRALVAVGGRGPCDEPTPSGRVLPPVPLAVVVVAVARGVLQLSLPPQQVGDDEALGVQAKATHLCCLLSRHHCLSLDLALSTLLLALHAAWQHLLLMLLPLPDGFLSCVL